MRIATQKETYELVRKIFMKYLCPELYKKKYRDENYVIIKYVDGVPIYGYQRNKK